MAGVERRSGSGRDILAATGNPDMLGTRAVEVLAPVWRGEGQTARSNAAALIAYCSERDQMGAVNLAQYALTVLPGQTSDPGVDRPPAS